MKKRVMLILIFILTLIKVNALDCQFSDWSMPGLQADNTIILDNETWEVVQQPYLGGLVRIIEKPRPGPIEGSSIISDDQAIQAANDFLNRNKVTLGIPGPTGFENFQGYVSPINVAYLNNDYFVYVERQYCGSYPVIGTYTSILMTDDATPYKIEFRWYTNINVNTQTSRGGSQGVLGGQGAGGGSILPIFDPEKNTVEFVLTNESYTPIPKEESPKNPPLKLPKFNTMIIILVLIAIIVIIVGIISWTKSRK